MNRQSFQFVRSAVDNADSMRILLHRLIDYAGLFPPASLSMVDSLSSYEKYAQSEWHWILGTFIVPVARLDEFSEALRVPPNATQEAAVAQHLSALLGSDVPADVTHIRVFNSSMARLRPETIIDAVELKVSNAEEVRRFASMIPAELTAYFEIPWPKGQDCVAAAAESGCRVKIRMGGETADKFPSSESVIDFMRLCAAYNVPFKATAGLHHPLRSAHRFTYQPESASGMMHGFLNVFLAASFLRAGMETPLAVQLLNEQSPQAFQFDRDGVSWRDFRISRSEIATARQHFAISFGSCSFAEPVEGLRSLGLL